MTKRSGVTISAVTKRSGVTISAVTKRSGVTISAVTKRSGVTISAVTNRSDPEETPEQRRALFRVVRGGPDDAELAALTVVLAAAGAGSAEPPGERGRSVWVDRGAMLRGPLHPGPGAWRTFTWPR